jgi:hypothetical protein
VGTYESDGAKNIDVVSIHYNMAQWSIDRAVNLGLVATARHMSAREASQVSWVVGLLDDPRKQESSFPVTASQRNHKATLN